MKRNPSPIPRKDPNTFPMRINKYLALNGFATRRGADELVTKKRVTLNGRFAVLGDKVEENDTVEVSRSKKPETYTYYAYNKPRGIHTERNRKGNAHILGTIPLQGVFPIGSLDVNSDGLVILSNDRRIIDRLYGPSFAHPKEYIVKTLQPLRPNFKEKMETGIIENGVRLQAHVTMLGDSLFRVRVTDTGAKLRHLCSLFFAEIQQMTRIKILNIELGKLALNSYRTIEDKELETFLKTLGL